MIGKEFHQNYFKTSQNTVKLSCMLTLLHSLQMYLKLVEDIYRAPCQHFLLFSSSSAFAYLLSIDKHKFLGFSSDFSDTNIFVQVLEDIPYPSPSQLFSSIPHFWLLA